jgi:hypothetical protein
VTILLFNLPDRLISSDNRCETTVYISLSLFSALVVGYSIHIHFFSLSNRKNIKKQKKKKELTKKKGTQLLLVNFAMRYNNPSPLSYYIHS